MSELAELARGAREGFESGAEMVTDPVSIALGVVLDPIGSALRATVGLPQATETAFVIGLHVEIIAVPTPAGPIPTPGPALFVGMVPPNLVGIAIDVVSWLVGGMTTAPVTGVFWSVLPAIAAGAGADGIHAPLIPGAIMNATGSVSFLMGSDSVDIGDHHSVRWLEMGMGCNHLIPFVTQSVDAPNSKLLAAVPTGFPVLVGGNSVIDVGAVIDAAIAFVTGQLLGALLDFGDGLFAQMASGVVKEIVKDALDGDMTAESLARDVAKGMWNGAKRCLYRRIDQAAATAALGGTASTSVRRVRSSDEPTFAIA
ncbi:MAG: hypothetical protein M3Y87_00285 [Myxococcota bacterium]|nr:hypothetical protein [Myxococcota bacterium]